MVDQLARTSPIVFTYGNAPSSIEWRDINNMGKALIHVQHVKGLGAGDVFVDDKVV